MALYGLVHTKGGYLYSSGLKCTGSSTSATVGPSGGTLSSTSDGTEYTFGPAAFPASSRLEAAGAVTVTHTPLPGPPTEALAAGVQVGVRHYYSVGAVNTAGQPVQPTRPYTVTVTYSDWDLLLSQVTESTLALYRWDGRQWVREPTSRLNVISNTVTANPSRFSTWGVLGRVPPLYVPLVLKR
jgi:hypothetical protein